MRQSERFFVDGLDELKAALKALPDAYKTRVIRDAHKEQLKAVKKKVRTSAPTPKQRAARNWSVRNDRARFGKNPTAAILAPTNEIFTLRFRERGTGPRVIKKGVQKPDSKYKPGAFKGARRGKITAQPFIERIYVEEARNIIKNVQPIYRETMEKVLKRHGVRISKKLSA